RWWEFYKNTWVKPSGANMGYAISNRAGSGIIWGNTTASSGLGIGLCEEDSGYPASYQIGRGQNQNLTPAYVFGNTNLSVDLNGCDAPEQANMVQANRDVYLDSGANCVAGGSCTAGIGSGTILPATCTPGVGFWKADAGGNWDTTNATSNDGALYKC